MFERRNLIKSRERIKGHDGDEFVNFAQEAAMSLANSVDVLIENTVERAIEQINNNITVLHAQLSQITSRQHTILDQLDDKLNPFRTQLTKFNTGLQQVSLSLERLEERLEQLAAENKLLENASREKQLLANEHYENHVIQPMVRSLFPTLDFVEDTRNGIPKCGENSDEHIQKLTEGVSIQLVQFLSAYGVEPIQHKMGAKFNPREMRPIKTETTHNKRLDGRVAKSLRIGFRGPHQRLLRPETVALFKYCEPKSITSNNQRRKS